MRRDASQRVAADRPGTTLNELDDRTDRIIAEQPVNRPANTGASP